MNNIRIKITGEKSITTDKERNAPKNKQYGQNKNATKHPAMHGKQSLTTRGGARRHMKSRQR